MLKFIYVFAPIISFFTVYPYLIINSQNNMNNLLLNYIIINFFKKFLIVIFIIYCFGIILNLFEEVEFFKNTGASIFTPLLLTCLFVPSLIIKLLPFIILFLAFGLWLKYEIIKNY